MMKYIAVLVILVLCAVAGATSVERYNGNETDLAKRWKWASRSSAAKKGGIWIGYSIEQKMDENCKIHSHSGWSRNQSLYELLGTSQPSAHSGLKNIAFIFRLDNADSTPFEVLEAKFGTFDSNFDFKDLPLYWLHSADEEESTSWLLKLYPKQNAEVKEDFVAAFGLHRTEASTKMLIKMAKTEAKEIQKDAVFWLGQPGHEEAFDFLIKTLRSHPEYAVRKAAVFSISQTESDKAVDILVEAARSDASHKIQKEAIFWLGQMAAEKSAQTLNSIIYDAKTLELKKHAVFSLSQIEDEKAENFLIVAAKQHPNLEVRKSAIFWLGEQGSDKALDVLVGILKK
jgi:hypothetical protein